MCADFPQLPQMEVCLVAQQRKSSGGLGAFFHLGLLLLLLLVLVLLALLLPLARKLQDL